MSKSSNSARSQRRARVRADKMALLKTRRDVRGRKQALEDKMRRNGIDPTTIGEDTSND